jgi:signal transduction histidine kinase
MGRLFWKFFFSFWLAQFVTGAVIGAAMWFLVPQHPGGPGSAPFRPPPPGAFSTHRMPPPNAGPPLPVLPIIAGSLVSVLFAGLLAWYFARPIRILRGAFEAVANGRLETRVGASLRWRHDELGDLGMNFDHMAERLEGVLAAQRRLLHDVSHELRSPMARAQAAVDLMRQQPERGSELRERILRDMARMDNLIGELLTLARLDSGISQSPSEVVDLHELVSSVADDAMVEAIRKDCRIEVDLTEHTRVKGDRELLYRAVENVVRNAVLHSPAGGCVTIIARLSEEQWIINISDQGSGVVEADLKAIFAPFFRSGNAPATTGYGLGLAIALRVAERHGGRVFAVNRPGGGLSVTFEMPHFIEP